MLTRGKVAAVLATAVMGAAVPTYAGVSDSITLELAYVGSETVAAASAKTTGNLKSNSLATNGFTVLTPTQLASQTTSEINFFDVYMDFVPGTSTPNDTFRSISFGQNVADIPPLTSGFSSNVNYATTSTTPNTVWLANNPTDSNTGDPLYSGNAAQVVSPYFEPVVIQQTLAGDSIGSLPGQSGSLEYVNTTINGTPIAGTKLGRFGVILSGPLSSTATIELDETNGSNFSYFTPNAGVDNPFNTTSVGVTSAVYSIAAAATPQATIALSPTSPGTLVANTGNNAVTVTNTAASGSDTVSLTNITLGPALNGIFSESGLSGSAIAANGGSQTGTIGFLPKSNVLNGVTPTGLLTFTADGTTEHATNGPINASYTLTAPATSGNVATASTNGSFDATLAQTATLASGTSLVGISSNTSSSQGNGVIGTTATFLYGTETSAGTITEEWRAHTTAENGIPVLSDVVQITGVTASPTNVYVLELSYNPAALPAGWSQTSKLDLGELNFDGDGVWLNAAANDQGGMANATPILAVWSQTLPGMGANSGIVDGTWGVDTVNHEVWAVLDHDAVFAVIPEPASLGVLSLGAMGLLARRRRR